MTSHEVIPYLGTYFVHDLTYLSAVLDKCQDMSEPSTKTFQTRPTKTTFTLKHIYLKTTSCLNTPTNAVSAPAA